MPSKTRPLCPGCGRPFPTLRTPIPDDLVLTWDQLRWLEKRIIVAMIIDHNRGDHGKRGMYGVWDMMALAETAMLRYRQVSNAMRRLVPTGWITRVRVGRYRLTVETVERVRPLITPGTRVTHFARK